MMKHLYLLFLTSISCASFKPKDPGIRIAQNYCLANAKFKGERYESAQVNNQMKYRVFWDFELLSASVKGISECPSSDYFLMIRGANVNMGLDRNNYIYPYNILMQKPEIGQQVEMKIRKYLYNDKIINRSYVDWRVTDFDYGFTKK